MPVAAPLQSLLQFPRDLQQSRTEILSSILVLECLDHSPACSPHPSM